MYVAKSTDEKNNSKFGVHLNFGQRNWKPEASFCDIENEATSEKYPPGSCMRQADKAGVAL